MKWNKGDKVFSLEQLSQQSAEQQARMWLLHLYSGEATEQHKSEFVSWLKSSQANAEAYKKVEQSWRDIPLAKQIGESKQDNKVSLFSYFPRKLKQQITLPLALAASLLLAVVGYQNAITDKVEVGYYATTLGQIELVELEDGSYVHLAPNSSFEIEFSELQRQIKLTSGTAYFDVTANPERPFVVIAGSSTITVVGTEFEIRKGQKNTRVSVTEGIVKLAASDAQQNTGKTLLVGEQVTINQSGTVVDEKRFQPAQVASWKQGRLTYFNETLEDIVEDVNRYRTTPIELLGTELKSETFTTAFDADKTDELLSALEQLKSVKIRQVAEKVVISQR